MRMFLATPTNKLFVSPLATVSELIIQYSEMQCGFCSCVTVYVSNTTAEWHLGQCGCMGRSVWNHTAWTGQVRRESAQTQKNCSSKAFKMSLQTLTVLNPTICLVFKIIGHALSFVLFLQMFAELIVDAVVATFHHPVKIWQTRFSIWC